MVSKKVYVVLYFYFMYFCFIFGSENTLCIGRNPFIEGKYIHVSFCYENSIPEIEKVSKKTCIAYCFPLHKGNTFMVPVGKVNLFIDSINNHGKKKYVEQHWQTILWLGTIKRLGELFKSLKKKDFMIRSSSFDDAVCIINASFMAMFLKKNDMLNKKHINTSLLLNFSNQLFDNIYLPSIQKLPVADQSFVLPKIKTQNNLINV